MSTMDMYCFSNLKKNTTTGEEYLEKLRTLCGVLHIVQLSKCLKEWMTVT